MTVHIVEQTNRRLLGHDHSRSLYDSAVRTVTLRLIDPCESVAISFGTVIDAVVPYESYATSLTETHIMDLTVTLDPPLTVCPTFTIDVISIGHSNDANFEFI